MVVYRLVNSGHDPIGAGQPLTRPSDHSNQKLGPGMYFAMDEAAALQFSKTRHGHTYTHLLSCDLVGLTSNDFVDIEIPENARAIRESPHGKKSHSERYYNYCLSNGFKGIIWHARAGWVELVLFEPFVAGKVIIKEAKALD